ncbi:MAG: hypothetical protein H3C45_01895 [Bacteroidia bacterium]|nr:hypothetical protein [Bacteroidia bacterium]
MHIFITFETSNIGSMYGVAKIWTLLLLLFCADIVSAQNEMINEPTLLLRKRFLYGFHLNSSSLGGINFKYQWQKTANIKNGIDFDLDRIRHPKEIRVYGLTESSRQYTPGRINMAFFFRSGYGQTLFITNRDYKNAVSIHYNYAAGATFAFLKPIYVDVFKRSSDPFGQNFIATEKYDPDNKPIAPQAIYGNAGFTNGFGEIKTHVGGYFKNSVVFEWGNYSDFFQLIEAGFCVDVFPNKLPLMAESYAINKNLFFTLFLGYSIGQNK